jgi:hypothetical protein
VELVKWARLSFVFPIHSGLVGITLRRSSSNRRWSGFDFYAGEVSWMVWDWSRFGCRPDQNRI